jgi:hypothetical protein
MKKASIWLLMLILVIMVGPATLVSTAKYVSTVSGADTVRVAKPLVQIKSLTAPANLGQIQIGQTVFIDFEVSNKSTDHKISEVTIVYALNIEAIGSSPSPFVFTLYYFDDQQVSHPLIQNQAGYYAGFSEFGTVAQTHRYRVHVSVPGDAVLMPNEQPFDLIISLIAEQGNL